MPAALDASAQPHASVADHQQQNSDALARVVRSVADRTAQASDGMRTIGNELGEDETVSRGDMKQRVR
jgi:hypothetical protein